MVIRSVRAMFLGSALACSAAFAVGCGQPEVVPDKATVPDEVELPRDPQASDPTLEVECALMTLEDWSTCEGQPSMLTGRLAVQVMQHPMIAAPFGPDGEGPGERQTYVDVEGKGQIIVLTAAEPVQCGGKVSVRGALERVDLGGEEGTKESYKGWSVRGATITCLE